MPRPARVSPDRILAAAAVEFSARGFSGARVDRIAKRARINKAMLYYHFGSKQTLYRALLRQTFTAAGDQLRAVADDPALSPGQKAERLVATMATFIEGHAHFPAIMLREVAEGGVHLDRDTLKTLVALPEIVGGVVLEGAASGVFRRVHPMMAYFTIFAPILLFMGGAPIRRQLAAHQLVDLSEVSPALFIRHLQESVRLALAPSRTSRSS